MSTKTGIRTGWKKHLRMKKHFLDIDGFLCVRLKNTAGCAVFSLVLCSRSLVTVDY